MEEENYETVSPPAVEEEDQKPKREKITLETEIPPLPPKSERLPAPDEDKFNREVKIITDKIDRLKGKKQGVQKIIKEKLEGGRMEAYDQSAKELIGNKKASRKELQAKRQELLKQLDNIKNEFYKLIEAQKKIRPKIKLFESKDVERRVDELQRRIETTTMPLSEEKKLIAELSSLQQSLPYLEQFKTRSQQIDENKAAQEEIKAQLNQISSQLDETNSLINATQERMRQSKNKLDEEIPTLKEESKQISEEIKGLETQRKELRDEFNKQKREYQAQKRQIRYIEWATKLKTRLIEQEERRKAKEEADRLAELNKPHPYEREITQCENYVHYLNKLLPQDTQEEQPKKKKQKKRRKNAGISSLPIEMLQFFSSQGIKVPTTEQEVRDVISELENKRDYFESQEERVEEEQKETKETKQEKPKQVGFNPGDFPEPQESQTKESYHIFQDEGPTNLPTEQKPTRGRGRGRRFRK